MKELTKKEIEQAKHLLKHYWNLNEQQEVIRKVQAYKNSKEGVEMKLTEIKKGLENLYPIIKVNYIKTSLKWAKDELRFLQKKTLEFSFATGYFNFTKEKHSVQLKAMEKQLDEYMARVKELMEIIKYLEELSK